MAAFFLVFVLTVSLTQALPQVLKQEHELLDFSFSKPSIRIIGGDEATPHAYPYQAGIFLYTSQGTLFCGGSLIATDIVLTAAHCVDDAFTVQVVLGAHEIRKAEASTVTLVSNKFIIYEDWDIDQLTNDIALIKLPHHVTLDENIQTIKIASGADTYAETIATVTGWGLSSDTSSDITPALRVLKDKVMSNENCKTIKPFDEIIIDSHLCIDGASTVGTCSGDFGGPLVLNGTQIGIASFDYSRCEMGFPSVFTRVANYYDWIQRNLNDSSI